MKNNLTPISIIIFLIFFSISAFLTITYLDLHANTTQNDSDMISPEIQRTSTTTSDQSATSTNDQTISKKVVEEKLPSTSPTYRYIEIIDGCDHNFEDECLNARSGPGTHFPVAERLRTGTILKVSDVIENSEGTWYEIVFDEWLRYPSRVKEPWYISKDYVRLFTDAGVVTQEKIPVTSQEENREKQEKRIEISRSQQTLVAYSGETLFMEADISTGLELTPTPRGTFTIFRKTPTRYMQGPIPGISSKYWDLPGVPWNLYFTEQGAVIHGAYWHDNFGSPSSNGCVNIDPREGEKLYKWADIGTTVIVMD